MSANLMVGVFAFFLRPTLVAMVMKIWDSTSNSEIMVQFMAKGLDRHSVSQSMAYLDHTLIHSFIHSFLACITMSSGRGSMIPGPAG